MDKHHHHHNHTTAPHHTLIIAIAIILSFAAIEIIAGWWANSLALISDAGHMACDALALTIAAFAAWLSQKPPSKKHSYGLGRAEVIAAWFSSLLMLVISIAVIIEAIDRLHRLQPVKGGTVMIIAAIGLLINISVAWLLAHGERTLNIRAALLHVMADLAGSLAALISGSVIYFTGWTTIDPILSIFISLLIMLSSLHLLKESLLVLMEGVPKHIDCQIVSKTMAMQSSIKEIHDLHIWTLSSGKIALSAHVDVHDINQWSEVLIILTDLLKNKFNISHVTLQPELPPTNCQPCNSPSQPV